MHTFLIRRFVCGLSRNRAFCCRPHSQLFQRERFSMYASSMEAAGVGSGIHVIDMRSDTVTKPTDEMRAAITHAEVGDDVFQEDPTINELQTRAAQMLGKEDALFVPSGTMGNLVSIMAHCGCRGDEILVGDQSHTVIYEQGGASQIAGVHTRQVITLPDGRLDLSDLESKVRSVVDPHLPVSKLICLEQTHANHGGRVLPLAYFDKVKDVASRYNLNIHVDGARLFNAASVLSVPVAQVVQHADSVGFCLSKGLGAPVGSMVVGSKAFIARCVRHRKVLGGGMRQAGILAAAGLYALENMPQRLHEDHANAKTLAQGLHKISGLHVNLNAVETNIVFLDVKKPGITADELVSKLRTVGKPRCNDEVIVEVFPVGKYKIRLVLHHQISADDVRRALQKFQLVMGA